MKVAARRAAGLFVLIGSLIGLAALSRFPYDPITRENAVIRLAWRFPGALVHECRRLSAEELDRLPIHMRRDEICEGRIVPYRLQVMIEDRMVVDEVVRAAGAREDRPLFVHRDIAVPPGTFRVQVSWRQEPLEGRESLPEGGDRRSGARSQSGGHGGPGHEDREHGGRRGGHARGAAAGYEVEASLRLAAREVALITYDPDHREFRVRGRGSHSLRD